MRKCNIISEKFTPEIISEFARLSRVEYNDLPTVTSAKHLNWKHLEGPFGPSIALHLKNENNIVGRTILQPKILQFNDKEIPVAFVTDALVHPDYRRPISNFLSLTLAIKEAKSFDLIFHSSNKKTEDIYSKILHFSCPFSLKGFGLPLKLTKLFSWGSILNIPYELALSAVTAVVNLFSQIKISDIAPKNFDEFCENECRKNNFLTKRNAEILQWRFRDAPLWQATVSHIYKEEIYCGYVVWRQLELNGKFFFVILDFLLSDEISRIQSFFLRFLLIKKAIRAGSDIIFTLLNPLTKLSKKFLGFPFVNVPDKFLPHATPIFVHANNPALIAMEREFGLHITLSDLDYF